MICIKLRLPQRLVSFITASILTVMMPAAFAADTDTTKPIVLAGYTVLQTSGDIFLVKNKSGREALIFKNPIGKYQHLGFIGKIKRGAELYHWGNGTPEQAQAWDKAGRIPPELLNHLKAKDGINMMGGGFYASTHKTDSINYGNVQIVIEMPFDVKVLTQTPELREWNDLIPDIEKLGISVIQHPLNPTWFNFIDANALTKEHVTKASGWKNSWEISQDKVDLINKFPEIYTEPSQKTQVLRYLNYWKMLASPDENVVLEAYKYFFRIDDVLAIDIAFKRFGSKNRQMMIDTAIALIQSKRPLNSYHQFLNVFSGDQGPETFELFKFMLQSSNEYIRRASIVLLGTRMDRESLSLIHQALNDPSEIVKAQAKTSIDMLKYLAGLRKISAPSPILNADTGPSVQQFVGKQYELQTSAIEMIERMCSGIFLN